MEDPLKVGRQYGTIQNRQVRRRTGQRPLPATSMPLVNRVSKVSNEAMKAETASGTPLDPKATLRRTSTQGETKPKDQAPEQNTQEKRSTPKLPSLKRDQSDFFKSFAKPHTKLSRENTDSSVGASPAPQTESPAADSPRSVQEDAPTDEGSESEEVEDLLVAKDEGGKSKRAMRFQREEQLRNLMNDDADDKPTMTMVAEADEQQADEAPGTQTEEEPARSPVTSGGRRRGRRKVMKKRTLKDEEGYLVTKEELAWESFSEDEPPPKKGTPASTASSTVKDKKASVKAGQGSIMSFFGKK
ncbi:MAG: hypothetical protein Q9170_001207 [Blastenia crenularia]